MEFQFKTSRRSSFLQQEPIILIVRGIILGDLVESSTSTSATLSDLPNNIERSRLGMNGTTDDILNNSVQVGHNLVFPVGTQMKFNPQANEGNEVDEQANPVQSEGHSENSDPSEEINISADDDTHTENEVSEESQETLNIRVTNNGSM